MTSDLLAGLGWSDHFARQTGPEDTGRPARLTAIHRTRLDALGPDGPLSLVPHLPASEFAVGDWVLAEGERTTRLLDRQTLLARAAAGGGTERQLIAANVDTLGIVTSCNADFNPARLERYLALALGAGCLPLILITRADTVDDPESYRRQAEALSPLVTALTLNARDPEEARRLDPWCRDGQTLALVGSSGVGKTTLQNALTGTADLTAGIREDDAKGRHTTTRRGLRATLSGGWIIDTPGMRELRILDIGDGLDAVFDDIADLAAQCRFRDCAHDTEPGCAVQEAVAEGRLDPARLARWRKLQREEVVASASIAETRAKDRAFGRMAREAKEIRRQRRGE